jgi:uncharacterized membrane protein (UPF0136 family)
MVLFRTWLYSSYLIQENKILPNITIAIGVLLILVGLIGYFATGGVSPTALIPSAIGLVITIAGALALSEGRRKHAMHAAVAIALLGFLGTVKGLAKLPILLANGVVERPAAVVSQSITAILCIILVGLGVRSFIAARRNR